MKYTALVRSLTWVGLAGAAWVLSACSTTSDGNKIDYRSASQPTTKSLDVPPDLTQIRRDSRFAIPDMGQSSASANQYAQGKGSAPVLASNVVALNQAGSMYIERNGSQRYLVMKTTPENVWTRLKDFWQSEGFVITKENEQTGVMETDWAENRGKIPQDMIRSAIGKLFDGLYSTGERDKFRTRLERTKDGAVEIYISHRGAQEVLTGSNKDSTAWTSRANDPNLEAEFLVRLMMSYGQPEQKARAILTEEKTIGGSPRSVIHTKDGLSYLQTDEGFDRTWRRVGLALDRIGFVIDDRDRSQGIYYVQYVDQEGDAKSKASQGFFAKLFSWGSKDDIKDGQKYRILVKEHSANVSHITAHGEDGKVSGTPVATKILTVLNEQLK